MLSLKRSRSLSHFLTSSCFPVYHFPAIEFLVCRFLLLHFLSSNNSSRIGLLPENVFVPLLYRPTHNCSRMPSYRLFETDINVCSFAVFSFYSAPQCSHCKRCSYRNSVRPSVRLSGTRPYCVKPTESRMIQFALSGSKMCLVL